MNEEEMNEKEIMSILQQHTLEGKTIKEKEEKGKKGEEKKKKQKKTGVIKNAEDIFLILSNLQKSVRRGEDEKSMYLASLLLESGLDTQLWNRMIVFAYEDCAGLLPVIAVKNLKELYFTLKAEAEKTKDAKQKEKKMDSIHMLSIKAIREISLISKDRTADDFMLYKKLIGIPGKKITNVEEDVDDVAKDRHTRIGRKLGRGWGHFFHEGCKLANESPNYNKKYIEELKEAYPYKNEKFTEEQKKAQAEVKKAIEKAIENQKS